MLEERAFKEIIMPTGIVFRMYDDKPNVWTQIKQTPDEQNWIEPMFQAWERGQMKGK